MTVLFRDISAEIIRILPQYVVSGLEWNVYINTKGNRNLFFLVTGFINVSVKVNKDHLRQVYADTMVSITPQCCSMLHPDWSEDTDSFSNKPQL